MKAAVEIARRWGQALESRQSKRAVALVAPDVSLLAGHAPQQGRDRVRDWLDRQAGAMQAERIFARGENAVIVSAVVRRDPRSRDVRSDDELILRLKFSGAKIVEIERHGNLESALDAAGLTRDDESPAVFDAASERRRQQQLAEAWLAHLPAASQSRVRAALSRSAWGHPLVWMAALACVVAMIVGVLYGEVRLRGGWGPIVGGVAGGLLVAPVLYYFHARYLRRHLLERFVLDAPTEGAREGETLEEAGAQALQRRAFLESIDPEQRRRREDGDVAAWLRSLSHFEAIDRRATAAFTALRRWPVIVALILCVALAWIGARSSREIVRGRIRVTARTTLGGVFGGAIGAAILTPVYLGCVRRALREQLAAVREKQEADEDAREP